MQEMDIVASYSGPNLIKRVKQAKLYPYLLWHLDIKRANQVWSIDITYICIPTIFVYLTAITHWYSRFIVGYSISKQYAASRYSDTHSQNAVMHCGYLEIINSDQGSQFTLNEYISLIKSFNHTGINMDGKSRASDNILILDKLNMQFPRMSFFNSFSIRLH